MKLFMKFNIHSARNMVKAKFYALILWYWHGGNPLQIIGLSCVQGENLNFWITPSTWWEHYLQELHLIDCQIMCLHWDKQRTMVFSYEIPHNVGNHSLVLLLRSNMEKLVFVAQLLVKELLSNILQESVLKFVVVTHDCTVVNHG